MARINERLPGCLAAGFVFGPEFKTMIQTGPNGAEYRNRDWRYGRWRATGNYHAYGPDEQQMLDAAFQSAAGMWAAFRVRDESHPARWQVEDQPLEPEIGSSTPLQVMRSYSWGGFVTDRIIQAVDASDFILKRNGVAVSDYTLDDELGLLTPDSTWASGTYTWSGSHDLWMRFNSDWGALSVTAQKLSQGEIELIEDRQYADDSSSS